jgi:hypothetical protein
LVRLGIRLWEGEGALLLLLPLLSVISVLCAIASPLQVSSRFSVTTRVPLSLSLSLSDYLSEFCSHGMYFSSSSSSNHFFFFFSEPIAASVAFPWTTEWSGE